MGSSPIDQGVCNPMARRKVPKLPATGDAFAFPLADGRFSVCRVLLDAQSAEARDWGSPTVFATVSEWIGPEIPSVDDPALRPILHMKHHSWDNEPATLWVDEEPPSDFVYLGKIEPASAEQALSRMKYGCWDHLTDQPLLQWRWDHEREAVLAEDAIRRQAADEIHRVVRERRAAYLDDVTLEDLRTHRFFRKWKIPPPRASVPLEN